MRTLLALLLVLSTTTIAFSDDKTEAAPAKTELKSLRDKASYSIGLSIGRNIKHQGFDLDLTKLVAGISDGIRGAKPQIADEEIQETMKEFEQEHTDKQAAKLKVAAEKNKADGTAFLAKNKKAAGIVTTKSGLQYQVLKAGKGEKPKKTDTVTTHYVGNLLDGTEFDSSLKRGKPATFPVNGVIGGWTEALQLMPVGSKWRLFIPSELAYGAQGAGPDIGPNSTLVFEVELLGIGEPEETEPAPEEVPEQ